MTNRDADTSDHPPPAGMPTSVGMNITRPMRFEVHAN
jgi:hypothetical protein